MSKIKNIIAKEIKDSRGRPTLEVLVETEKGEFLAGVPSGTSTGKNEALELKDADGLGVSLAIKNVNEIISKNLKGKDPENQNEIDQIMIDLDGTENKSKLGANAIVGVSMAVCRAGAASKKIPLYQHILELCKAKPYTTFQMPKPCFNILEGGVHTDNQNDTNTQEFMIVPQKKTFAENLILGSKIFNNLKDILVKNYGENKLEIGFEGGFALPVSTTLQALFFIKNAIGKDQAKIALDVAASEFYENGKYFIDKQEFTRSQLLEFYKDLAKRFEIISIEDPFSEDDWEGFSEIKKALPDITIIGDDLTTTNIKKVKEAEAKKACNGVILKVNQIGTVSETINAANVARSYGWIIMVSHRSGETADDFIADLAVGLQAEYIKSGACSKDERMVKYKRLLEIESELKK